MDAAPRPRHARSMRPARIGQAERVSLSCNRLQPDRRTSEPTRSKDQHDLHFEIPLSNKPSSVCIALVYNSHTRLAFANTRQAGLIFWPSVGRQPSRHHCDRRRLHLFPSSSPPFSPSLSGQAHTPSQFAIFFASPLLDRRIPFCHI